MADIPKIPLRQGRNVWRMWASDRSGAPKLGIQAMVGPAVARSLRSVQTTSPWELVRTDDGHGNPQWRAGAARPIELTELVRYETAHATGPAMGVPAGSVVLARRETYPGDGLPTVRGKLPWWAVVDVWWRKPDTTIPWPGFRVDYGISTDTVIDADWVLERAVYVPARSETKPDPGDSTAAEEHAAEAFRFAFPPTLLVLLALGLGYASYKEWI